jgi:hypothetical protein
VLAALLLGGPLLGAQSAGTLQAQAPGAPSGPLTRPERSNFEETSRYADVMSFLEEVTRGVPWMHLTTMGYTMEGRAIPLVVVGRVSDASPAGVRASGKLRVYAQGNIHAGEVCGKEALQVLLRDLAQGAHAEWLDSLVLLIAPIYNADGNERVRLTNRPYQYGPLAGMGQRANAQGLDLNRDHMKVEAPETRALVRLMNTYDPHVLIDLHTTNGPLQAYHLTYAPPLNPNTDAGIVELLRGDWLPSVSRAIREKHGWEYYYYGFTPWRGSDLERGWYTFGHEPRYNTNYIGLRNRFGILGEAYSYAPFEERILAALRFVEELANWAQRNASRIRRAVERADAADLRGRELALSADFERAPEPAEILMGEVAEERNPYSGETMLRMLDVRHVERMPEFGTFRPTRTERAPAAYLVPAELEGVLRALDDHGVRWSALARERRLSVERFVIDSLVTAEREYQGHRERTLFGTYETVELTIPAGTAVVAVEQPLGRLAFLLLEPLSDDGLAHWNVLDEALEEAAAGARYYPLLRAPRWRD